MTRSREVAPGDSDQELLGRSEVARILGVSPNTVTRWAREGRLPSQVTLGGHHRFARSVVERLKKESYRGSGDAGR